MGSLRKSVSDRFWPKVDKRPGQGPNGDCWEWQASRKGNGYGQLGMPNQRPRHAHVIAYELTHGPLEPGLFVLHRCDNPPCVRPDHLFAGSHMDNMRDAQAKGRMLSKLTDEQVAEIRATYRPGEVTLKSLATRYGVSESMISRVVNGHRR